MDGGDDCTCTLIHSLMGNSIGQEEGPVVWATSRTFMEQTGPMTATVSVSSCAVYFNTPFWGFHKVCCRNHKIKSLGTKLLKEEEEGGVASSPFLSRLPSGQEK